MELVVLWIGDYDFAVSKGNEALALNPIDAGAYITLGAAHDFIGHHDGDDTKDAINLEHLTDGLRKAGLAE